MLEAFAIYLALGAAVGVIAGLLGVGGGLIIVPVLSWVLVARDITDVHAVHLAIGTSLATIVLTSMSSVRAHHHRGAVRWDVVAHLAPGIILGAFGGAWLSRVFSADGMRVFFACFEFLIAANMLLDLKTSPHRGLPGAVGMGSAGGVIGAISALLGIGGGTLTVPFLVWCNVGMREAVATASACGLPIAVAGAIGFMTAGLGLDDLPHGATGYIYWPAFAGIVATSVLTAPLGARLAHTLPAAQLKRVFALLLITLGVKMLLD